MGRRRFVVALAAAGGISVALAGHAPAQNPAPPDAAPRIAPQMRPPPQMRPATPERWRQMSPEDRQRFKSNAERWLAMPAEERRALREREGIRRERMQREAEAAMRESGLQLEAERRAQFQQRYLEERQRIDRALREELKQKRQRELEPVVERLKKEFGQTQGSSTPASSASASPSPK